MADILTCSRHFSRIKNNSFYISNLQRSHECHNEIFLLLVSNDFEIGQPESMVYSLIARGELTKVKCIADIYVIEDFQCIFDIALKYGRSNIISYFIEDLKLKATVDTYGKILDFDNLSCIEPIFLYWEDGGSVHPPENGKQDYGACLDLILRDYQYPITVSTLDKWCELIKSKSLVKWDVVDAAEILNKLKVLIRDPIPAKHDFGRFNHIIHDNVQDVEVLMDLIAQLKEELYTLQTKYDSLLVLYRSSTK
jgi:hypothetical protein